MKLCCCVTFLFNSFILSNTSCWCLWSSMTQINDTTSACMNLLNSVIRSRLLMLLCDVFVSLSFFDISIVLSFSLLSLIAFSSFSLSITSSFVCLSNNKHSSTSMNTFMNQFLNNGNPSETFALLYSSNIV